jgi:hypothetical protein
MLRKNYRFLYDATEVMSRVTEVLCYDTAVIVEGA